MRGKKYTIYSIVTTLLEEAALAATVIWLLPKFGINIPIWVLSFLMIAWGTYSYITYRLTKKVQCKEVPTPADIMIGRKGTAVTSLDPDGIVKLGGELWKASATDSPISAGDEIVVMSIRGLILSVTRDKASK